jgi:DNA-binding NarL/FixJ family response regulator
MFQRHDGNLEVVTASAEAARNLCRETVRVLLADDHHLVRAGIRALLEKIEDVTIAGEACDGREVLEFLDHDEPDVLLLDISMPRLNGMETLARIAKEFSTVRVIVLSVHQNREYLWQAINAGAAGYLLKRASAAELERAIATVRQGRFYLSSELSPLARQLPLIPACSRHKPLDQLTARQREILQLMAEGETTKGIALLLKISSKTVEYHRAQLMERLKIFDLPGLVRFAMRSGLIAEGT